VRGRRANRIGSALALNIHAPSPASLTPDVLGTSTCKLRLRELSPSAYLLPALPTYRDAG